MINWQVRWSGLWDGRDHDVPTHVVRILSFEKLDMDLVNWNVFLPLKIGISGRKEMIGKWVVENAMLIFVDGDPFYLVERLDLLLCDSESDLYGTAMRLLNLIFPWQTSHDKAQTTNLTKNP